MVFSIVGFDPANGGLGVAVLSKFPNVGVNIPSALATHSADAAMKSALEKGGGPSDRRARLYEAARRHLAKLAAGLGVKLRRSCAYKLRLILRRRALL